MKKEKSTDFILPRLLINLSLSLSANLSLCCGPKKTFFPSNTTTTAIVQYISSQNATTLPSFPLFNDSVAAYGFIHSIRSLNSKSHPISPPVKIDERMLFTLSVNAFPCTRVGRIKCEGPNGTSLAASINNVSFNAPRIDILEAYFYKISGIFERQFPSFPPFVFNYTTDFVPFELQVPTRGTQARVISYNSTVEIVFQGTSLFGGIDHPMHMHGYTFYVVGWGFGNFDEHVDPLNYNLVDPQKRNTVIVPRNGWTAVRFTADNPGVWFMHCHFERHLTWGMETVFIVKNGKRQTERLLPPPTDMPPC